MASIKNSLLICITAYFLVSGIQVTGQSDTVKTHKIKFDWELGPPGAGVNFSLQQNEINYFGVGINILYPYFVITPEYVRRESEGYYNWGYINCKFFFRNIINKYITMEYSMNYSYSHFGCISCESDKVHLFGVQVAPIFGSRKVKYKPTIAVARSFENPDIYFYIMPLVFNFNL